MYPASSSHQASSKNRAIHEKNFSEKSESHLEFRIHFNYNDFIPESINSLPFSVKTYGDLAEKLNHDQYFHIFNIVKREQIGRQFFLHRNNKVCQLAGLGILEDISKPPTEKKYFSKMAELELNTSKNYHNDLQERLNSIPPREIIYLLKNQVKCLENARYYCKESGDRKSIYNNLNFITKKLLKSYWKCGLNIYTHLSQQSNTSDPKSEYEKNLPIKLVKQLDALSNNYLLLTREFPKDKNNRSLAKSLRGHYHQLAAKPPFSMDVKEKIEHLKKSTADYKTALSNQSLEHNTIHILEKNIVFNETTLMRHEAVKFEGKKASNYLVEAQEKKHPHEKLEPYSQAIYAYEELIKYHNESSTSQSLHDKYHSLGKAFEGKSAIFRHYSFKDEKDSCDEQSKKAYSQARAIHNKKDAAREQDVPEKLKNAQSSSPPSLGLERIRTHSSKQIPGDITAIFSEVRTYGDLYLELTNDSQEPFSFEKRLRIGKMLSSSPGENEQAAGLGIFEDLAKSELTKEACKKLAVSGKKDVINTCLAVLNLEYSSPIEEHYANSQNDEKTEELIKRRDRAINAHQYYFDLPQNENKKYWPHACYNAAHASSELAKIADSEDKYIDFKNQSDAFRNLALERAEAGSELLKKIQLLGKQEAKGKGKIPASHMTSASMDSNLFPEKYIPREENPTFSSSWETFLTTQPKEETLPSSFQSVHPGYSESLTPQESNLNNLIGTSANPQNQASQTMPYTQEMGPESSSSEYTRQSQAQPILPLPGPSWADSPSRQQPLSSLLLDFENSDWDFLASLPLEQEQALHLSLPALEKSSKSPQSPPEKLLQAGSDCTMGSQGSNPSLKRKRTNVTKVRRSDFSKIPRSEDAHQGARTLRIKIKHPLYTREVTPPIENQEDKHSPNRKRPRETTPLTR